MENIPVSISILFALVAIMLLFAFYKTARLSPTWGIVFLLWLAIQGVLAKSGFYSVLDTKPPRFLGLILPPVAMIGVLLFSRRGRSFINGLDPATLTLLHLVRIPVELILFWLFTKHAIPRELTFEGKNPDMLAGLSAPLVYYFAYRKKEMKGIWILIWNLVCLGLLINVVARAVGFVLGGSPLAITVFPFVWLPCFMVPVVLFAHLSVILSLQRSWGRGFERLRG